MGFYVIIIYRRYVLFNCKSFIEALHDFVELHNVKEIKADLFREKIESAKKAYRSV